MRRERIVPPRDDREVRECYYCGRSIFTEMRGEHARCGGCEADEKVRRHEIRLEEY